MILSAGGFHGATADGFATGFALGVVHAVAMVVQVVDFALNELLTRGRERSPDSVQIRDYRQERMALR